MASGMDSLVAASDTGDSRSHLQLTAQIKKLTNRQKWASYSR